LAVLTYGFEKDPTKLLQMAAALRGVERTATWQWHTAMG
jgi:hypothetical protein